MTKTSAWYAERYAGRFGMALVPIEPRRKFPTADDWGKNVITDESAASSFWSENPEWNIGLALGPSRFCSLDIDCAVSFAFIMEEYGIPENALDSFPTIQGSAKGRRVMFRVPDGVSLPYEKLNWPTKEDQRKKYTVIELRSSCDGKQRQDVLPPSIHPDTGKPYRWIVQPPATLADWPTPPGWLMAIWEAWDKFKPQLVAVCPWAEKHQPPAPAVQVARAHTGDSVIDAYCRAVPLEDALARSGYRRVGKRYLSPHSTTGLPGVTIMPGGSSCWIHHASDPLCSEDTGKPVNSFDLFVTYDHGGNMSSAVKAAAAITGMDRTPKARKPAPVKTQTETAHNPPASSPACIPQYDFLPDCNDKGKPLATIENVAEICRRLGVTIRYNVISKDEELIIPGQSFSLDNGQNASFAWLLSYCARFDMRTDKLGDFVTYLADVNPYNPVAEWITSAPWDGVSRLVDFYSTVKAIDEDTDYHIKSLKESMIQRWLLSAIAAAFSPTGVAAGGILVLQGPQYLGKTKWFKTLTPEWLGVAQDGMTLRPDDRDSVKQAVSFWLVELGELDATFRKSDIAALKSFITRKSDVLRRAYARRESQYARRTVFFASVNPQEFLADPTGNRRYWTISCDYIDHSHNLDMQQVWAEVLTMWQSGASHYLDANEVASLNIHNEQFTHIDPVDQRLQTALDWDEPRTLWRWITVTELLMQIGFDRPTHSDATRAGTALAKLAVERRVTRGRTQVLVPNRLSGGGEARPHH